MKKTVLIKNKKSKKGFSLLLVLKRSIHQHPVLLD